MFTGPHLQTDAAAYRFFRLLSILIKDSMRVRSAARVHSEEFRQCVALQAQYVFDTFGKFPGTVPSIFLIMHLQAHHLDLEFYEPVFQTGVLPEDPCRSHEDMAPGGLMTPA